MNTTPKQAAGGRRCRRNHSDEFKAEAVSACMQSGVSMAAIAMARGVNANLLRRWVRESEERCGVRQVTPASAPATSAPTFVPLQVRAATAPSSDIRIEVRRGATSVSVTWPSEAAAQCAAWMRELLR